MHRGWVVSEAVTCTVVHRLCLWTASQLSKHLPWRCGNLMYVSDEEKEGQAKDEKEEEKKEVEEVEEAALML